MVLFALVVVVILGTIGLVIEVGTVRVTRERMQSAADSVALEVLRERDLVVDVDHDAFDRDRTRRERNRRFASWTFANEISDSYTGDEQGAGPYIDLESTAADPDPVDRSLMLREVGHGVPVLETNYDGGGTVLNEKYGDIVSGEFTPHEGGVSGNPIYREAADYTRLDFTPAESEDAPMADSVLVRLRRTVPHIAGGGPWNDVQEDVSSSGWTLPLVFGLGSTFMAGDPGAEYSIRHHGLPLRATAIAEARPAVRIGEARPDLGDEWAVGAGPLAIRLAEWNSDGPWRTEQVPSGEPRYYALIRLEPDYSLITIDHDSNVFGFLSTKFASQVGDVVDPEALQPQGTPDSNLEEEYWMAEVCYVPLYLRGHVGSENDEATIFDRHICAYGRVSIMPEPQPSGQLPGIYFRVTKLPNELSPGKPWMAARNASAVFDGTQPTSTFENSQGGTGTYAGFGWPELMDELHANPQGGSASWIVPGSRVYAPAHAR